MGCDIIAIHAADAEALAPAVERATKAGVPCVGFNKEISGGNLKFAVVSSDNVATGASAAQWLADKAKEEGVKPLPKGIYYKVINEGKDDGKHPSPRSIVTAHYTGWTINGKKFDTSRGGTPIAFRLNELIEGWIIAMQQMCIGDKWEIYIPAEMGYGKFSQPGIPGGSTLIFEIELFGIA